MKNEYDFSKGKRGPVVPAGNDTEVGSKVTIRLDPDILDRFLAIAEQSGGVVSYQDLINSALRQYLEGKAAMLDEATLRRIIREELKVNAA